jgi:hypothetical protein
MSKIVFVIYMMLILIHGHASSMACTKEEAFTAEATILDISTWKELFESYKLYIHCDDGAIAAGYSDVVVRLLAFKWEELEKLIELIDTDTNFYTFVLHHIDATADQKDLERIIENCTNACPDNKHEFCSIIKEQSVKALYEMQKCHSSVKIRKNAK